MTTKPVTLDAPLLHGHVDQLLAAANRWNQRSGPTPAPEVRQAVDTAVEALDAALTELRRIRRQLLAQVRRSDKKSSEQAPQLVASAVPQPASAGAPVKVTATVPNAPAKPARAVPAAPRHAQPTTPPHGRWRRSMTAWRQRGRSASALIGRSVRHATNHASRHRAGATMHAMTEQDQQKPGKRLVADLLRGLALLAAVVVCGVSFWLAAGAPGP